MKNKCSGCDGFDASYKDKHKVLLNWKLRLTFHSYYE